ncbi:MAG: UbiH/UbiF/VisC/COQ6 family ubiquinone biosynthesis hydroxylase [Gammaproteobacteria bacterium]|nr:UbiH/UbiF/VisC/COQ6 family ubiquinone biosynthesis hydroxylase [Gammaproteobacteria bacterium]
MNENINYDIIIVGGGMVGASLACGLAEGAEQLKIAVIDANAPNFDWDKDSYDMRVSAITRASQNIFKNMGVWENIVEQRVSPYYDMFVWDAGNHDRHGEIQHGEIHFDSADMGEADLGHIIENRIIVKALYQRMQEMPQISLYCPTRLEAIAFNQDKTCLTLQDKTKLTANLIVGADGTRSWVRQQADIAVKGWDFDQAALVTTVKTEKYHQDTAWQRFLSTGPLAFLPLTDGYSSIVWSTSPGEAQRLTEIPEAEFALELEQAFEGKLGKIVSVAGRAVFPLRLFETLNYVKPRLALVGDAAHTIHPLAGQGVNLGLADVASLITVIIDALNNKKDIGDFKVLRRYERWRRADNRSMLVAMDGLKRLFGSELSVVKGLRGFGLNMVNKITPLKNLIMQQAMGIGGTGPGSKLK